MNSLSIVIPAYNEERRIGSTLQAITKLFPKAEIIVVNDGSSDNTEQIAKSFTQKILTLPENKGKGFALQRGWEKASGQYIACLDADLEESAKEVAYLFEPVQKGEADMTISIIKPGKKAGMGVVRRRVQSIIYKKTGIRLEAPLSGQRVFHRSLLPVLLQKPYQGFGVEAQMTIDVLQSGARCLEVPTTMTHRELGKNLYGFIHRLKQWLEIEKQFRGVRS